MKGLDFVKFQTLVRKMNAIHNSPIMDWEKKYDLIFSDSVSIEIGKLISISCADPDTSYEEDVRAYVKAVNIEHERIIQKAENSNP